MKLCSRWLLLAALLASMTWKITVKADETTTSASSVQEQVWESRGCVDDARGKWFCAAKFGAFIHFGLYSQLGGYYHGKGRYRPAEQIMGLGDRRMVIPWKEYQTEIGGAFNPTNFDARQWGKGGHKFQNAEDREQQLRTFVNEICLHAFTPGDFDKSVWGYLQ